MTVNIPMAGTRGAGLFLTVDDADAELVREVDHVNGNKLDNRRANLRLATHAENQRNSRQRSHSGQPFKGERWLGSYATPEQAAAAYDAAARELHGAFARPNGAIG